MASHLLTLLVFAGLSSTVFAVILRDDKPSRVRFALLSFGAFVVSALAVGWLMYPFPN